MSNRKSDAKAADLSKVNANVVTGAMIVGAILLAFVGTMLPGWAGMTGSEATLIPLVFYLFAAIDVGIAFYLRSFIRKAQRNGTGGGAVRRQ